MALQSLVAEITGAIPISDLASEMLPGRRVLIVFENSSSTLRGWHDDLMAIDRDRLRLLNLSVVGVFSESKDVLLDGSQSILPIDELIAELLGSPQGGAPVVVLLSSDGRILLRSDHAVTIQHIGDAIETLDRDNGWM